MRTKGAGTGPANFAVLAIGAGLLVVGLSGHAPRWSPPPVPAASAAVAAAAPAAKAPRHRLLGMRRSVPVAVDIPAIGVHAQIIPLGTEPDGEVAVPSLSTPFLASWYDRGPTPGQPGAAVLLGHVDAAGVGPAVFYRLGDLVPGNLIYVTRRDSQTAEFRVTSVGLYPQNAFPTMRVYGRTRRPALRLVTCGGQYDWTTHLYLDRTIVFADFVGAARR
jgi:sortase (surface protein transpeptidase)